MPQLGCVSVAALDYLGWGSGVEIVALNGGSVIPGCMNLAKRRVDN